jgi:hypothetical protein
MRRFSAIQLIVALIFALLAIPASGANVVEKLMMPGELSEPHAKLEEDCANCHKTLVKEAQTDLCLGCHKPIAANLKENSGFHGKNTLVSKSECYSCHVEHRGRNAAIVRLETISFDHRQTNYPLMGKHAQALCSGCHEAGKKFKEAKQACFDCHKADEPHRGQLGSDCKSCHSPEGWKKVATFDHSKTKFPLNGKHEKVACVSCHIGEIYKGVSTACNDCHAIQDVHQSRFGPNCADCHSVETWKQAKFDHNKNTRFALKGAHAKAICSDCHGNDTHAKLSMACIDCHRNQDVHKAQLGSQCGDCHGVTAWKQDVKFDHGLTAYPLIGLHAAVACEGCHVSRAYKGVATACISCHGKDDVHAGRLTSACASCHSPNGWARVTFDHSRDTRFALTGAHGKGGCYDCHTQKNVKSAELPTACIACHKRQDVHRGAFGTDCARCHTTATFKEAFIRK